MRTVINTQRDEMHGLSRSQQRVLAELQRLALVIRPGCLGAFASPSYEMKHFMAKLAKSQVEVLLADGPEQVSRIYDYVPYPWGALFLGSRPRTIEQATRLVALNLDWYVRAPTPLFRLEWIGTCLAALILLACTIGLLLLALDVLPFSGGSVMLMLATALLIWLLMHGDQRRAAWINALHDHLKDVYGANR
jgi:hypothetical protein